jgi:hypothetical protein
MRNWQTTIFRWHTRALVARPQKAHRHIRGVKKNFSNPLMMGIKKRGILLRFQKYKLVLVTKGP